MFNQEWGLLYFPILKNAHSALIQYLPKCGFERAADPLPKAPAFCFIRDPYRRYISSLAQVLRFRRRRHPSAQWGELLDEVTAMLPEVFTFNRNRHFEPQANTVARMPAAKILLPIEGLAIPRAFNVTADADVLEAYRRIDPAPILDFYAADVELRHTAR